MKVDARRTLEAGRRSYRYFDIGAVEAAGMGDISLLPVCLRILLENLIRHEDGELVGTEHIAALARWPAPPPEGLELALRPARILMPDSSGIPLLADLAAMRDAMAERGGRPDLVNPRIRLDLVVDHSVIVERAGTPDAAAANLRSELERNAERYAFLKWAQQAYANLSVVPPGNGICHQINIEALAEVVSCKSEDGETLAYPDLMIGMDSHTPMVNALGVLGWGVGGIEAATAMLGEPIGIRIPEVVGVRLSGELPAGVMTTDLVLTVTEKLRERGVIGAFVEFFGPGVARLALPERATLSNMAPEYGATAALFPVDEETIRFLRLTGRGEEHIALVETYAKAQGLWHEPETERAYNDVVEIDLTAVEPSIAGPRRPQDRLRLSEVPGTIEAAPSPGEGLRDGDVVIAAITSCTNTSNPSVMIAAGLLARNARARGLKAKPWVKTSLAPGSRVVSDYLAASGLQEYLDALGFAVAGYGCTTCMGNSGPLSPEIAERIEAQELNVAAVLSGNRNFENRIHTLVKSNYLMAPPLVVAYAIAGTVLTDLTSQPLGHDPQGRPVRLADIWPDDAEIREVIERHVTAPAFAARYPAFDRPEQWDLMPSAAGPVFDWDGASTHIRRPPFFEGIGRSPDHDLIGARALLVLGDSITTDHISPVSAIPREGDAASYLAADGVPPERFGSFMERRVNHDVMIRGTFANAKLANEMVEGRRGGFTRHMPDGTGMTVFEAAERYAAGNVPVIVVAGAGYGAGSSRDWAAKGTRLLGIRAILAESFERIHRSNLVGMGVLPLQFPEGTTRRTLRIDGSESWDILGIGTDLRPRDRIACRINRADGSTDTLELLARIDTARELDWYLSGGVLIHALLGLAEEAA